VTKGSRPLKRFSSKGNAWNFLWEKVREFDLCPKLCGLQLAKGLCFEYQTGECHGACLGVESTEIYNHRVEEAIRSFNSERSSLALIGKGRNIEEQSLVLVEQGSYIGYGFIDKQNSISDFESAKTYIKRSIETPTVQSLINGYVINPRGVEVVVFDKAVMA
jgi:DNA polymerase-3 subunit epsilon